MGCRDSESRRTSALTRGLHVLGVDSGGRLLPTIHGVNDKGFFEDADIGALNIELMSSLGHRRDSLAPIEPSVLTAAHAEPRRAIRSGTGGERRAV